MSDNGSALRTTIPMVSPAMGTPSSISGTMGLYPRSAPFFDAFPGTVDGLRQLATNNDQSQSKTMGWITVDALLAPWDDQQERELFDGQFVFCVPLDFKAVALSSGRESVRLQMPLLNLRHVNTFLRKGYEEAHASFQPSRGGQLPIEGEFRADQLKLMASRPVRDWHSMDFVASRYRAAADDSLTKQIVYLSERLLLERFNPFGWIHGQVPEDGKPKQVAIRRAGTIDDAENIWSMDLYPGDNLYFILRRIYDSGKGEWAHFAFVPWFGPTAPTLSECAYRDYTGHVEYGCAIYIGSVDRLTHDVRLRPDELPQLTGIEQCRLQRVKTGPEPGCVRITALGSKNRLPWMF